MHDVFISYSSKNKNVADAIVSDFEQNGIRCWYAPRDIRPGEEWVTAITKALEVSKALVLIYTEDSNTSRQVMNEIAVAFNAGITIVPFKLSNEQMSSELEYYLTRVHWLDALSKPLKKNIVSLREYIEVIISTPNGSAPVHTKSADEIAAEKLKAAEEYKKKVIKFVCCAAAVILILLVGGIYGVKKLDERAQRQAYADARSQFYTSTDIYDDGLMHSFLFLSVDNPESLYYFARMHERQGDYLKAQECYQAGVDKGAIMPLIGMGNLYLEGNLYVEKDLVAAKECFDNALFAGCTEANYYEAYMWAYGLIPGEDPDLPKAKEYADAALESEDHEIVALTYMLLGDMCRMGYGGAGMTREDALDYYDKVAELCPYYEGESYCRVGEYYYEDGDYELAIDWYKKASEKRSYRAMKLIGDMYCDGVGVDMDGEAALKYYLKAGGFRELDGEPYFDRDLSAYDDENLFNRLGLLYYYEYEYRKAIYFFKLSSEEFDSLNGKGNLGITYENLMDWDNALNWYGRAIDAGHGDSETFRRRIRIMVEDGLVSEADAKKWL